MYGTVNALCAKLLQQYRSDELITLIVWTKEDVMAVLDDSGLTEDGAAEMLSMMDSLGGLHEYGVGEDTLRVLLDNIREQEAQTREVSVPAAALEKVLRVAGDYMRREDAEGGEGSAVRRWPYENAAIRVAQAALDK
ncbi:DUF1380 family protein [Erwiniaceae bacterium L1_54_6]|nr:DUF1380 family protein [Erwiniaceae bacterium L1_54_6]